MKQNLSYVLISPYTVAKSRTGGVVSRLLLRADLELVGAQMIAPDAKFAEEFAALLETQQDPANPWAARLLSEYVRNNLGPSGGRPHRSLLLLFQGEDPCRKLSDICGALYAENRSMESITGETIRDTYADLILDPDDANKIIYFEPAVLTPRNQELADEGLKLFANWLPAQNPIVKNITYANPGSIEQTLVIIKPDNWKQASSRPGTIIDMFSRTGARIIGMKVHHMSVAETLAFYEPLRSSLKTKFAEAIGEQAKEILEGAFESPLSSDVTASLAQSFGAEYAEDQFQQVIQFMTGKRAEECSEEDLQKPGSVKCMILIYEGEHAVNNIRKILGPTDPTKAPGGTVRREFGMNIMVNTAHASSSLENAEREMQILKVRENPCAQFIKSYLDRV